MAVLGLILLAAAGVLTAAVVTSNTDSLTVSLWGLHISNVSVGVVFVAGMITTVLAVVGLGLLMGGARRNRRLRKERRTLRRENEQLAQRVDSTPDTPAARYEERRVENDRTRVQPAVPSGPGYDPAQADGSTAAPRRRGFLPRRDEPTTTETASRDN